jgi:hypothetical protein
VVLIELEEMRVGPVPGYRPCSLVEFLIGSHSPPLWSPYSVLQLVSELVWSLVGFNRLCDLKVIWRKVLSSMWSSMARIFVIRKTELTTIFLARVMHLGYRTGGVHNPGDTQQRDAR